MRGALLGLAALLVGCGDGYRDRNAYAVNLTDTGLFAPATLQVPLGASVTFHNAGTQPREVFYQPGDLRVSQSRPPGAPNLTPHTARPANAAPWRSGVLYPGESWTHTFTQPGAYVFQSPYAAGFPGTPNTAADAYGEVQGQQSNFADQRPVQVPAGVVTVEPVRTGQPGDTASDPRQNPPFPAPAAPPGGNE